MSPRPYRARNKRIIQRSGSGRFRQSNLADIGLAECKTCGAIFTPDFSRLKNKEFIDPREMRDITSYCSECNSGGGAIKFVIKPEDPKANP